VVPQTPEEFFGSYVPARMAALTDELSGKSSPGSVVVQLEEGSAWCLRIRNGAFEVAEGDAPDAIVRVSLSRDSFEPLVVRTAERDELAPAPRDRRLSAARALTLDAERGRLIREAAGSVALVVKDGAREHRVVVTPGARERGNPACTLRLGMDELIDLQAGRTQPLQLLMAGQLVIEGDAQIVMALAGALAG